MRVSKGALAGLVSVVAITMTSCSGAGSLATQTNVTPAPTETSEIPPGWVTYSDETSGFGISYPSDWEIFALDERSMEDLLAHLERAIGESSDPLTIISAGRLMENGVGYDPNVNVVLESVDKGITLDRYAELNMNGLEAALPSAIVTRQTKTTVDGREAMIIEASYSVSDLFAEVDPDERFWMVGLAVLDGQRGWTATCGTIGTSVEAVSSQIDACHSVVRSFEY